MPPRMPRQKAARKANVKQKQANHSPNEKGGGEQKDKERQSESESESGEYKIVDGREEILTTWLAELTPDEKRQVLDITTDELITSLQRAGYDQIDGKVRHEVDELLDNHELMTALRKSFVDAIHAHGVMEIPSSVDPILLTLISLLEHHLITIHTRKLIAYKAWLFIMAMAWFSTYWWFWRYSIILFTFYAGYSGIPRILHMKQESMSIFEDPSPHRMKARLHAFLSGLMCAWLCSWLPSSQYKLILIVLSLPLILIEIEKSTATTTDENALRYIRSFLLYVSECCTLYFVWWSWTMTLFVCLFFFPSLSCVIIAGSCMILSLTFPILSQIQSLFIPIERYPYMMWMIWFLSIITYYWTWIAYGWILSILHLFIILLLIPPILSQVLTVTCSGIGSALLSMGVGGVLSSGLQIVSVVTLAFVMIAINKFIPPIIRRFCPKYADRFKHADEEEE